MTAPSRQGGAKRAQSTVMCRWTFSLLLVLLCTNPSRGGAGFSDIARTSEFWIAEPFGLSRHLDYPREATLFRGRLIKDNDWMIPERFVHDEEVVRGVKGIACVNNTAIVGDTFEGDYFAIRLLGQEIHRGLSHAELSTLLAKWSIGEPRLLSFDEAMSTFNRSGAPSWLWLASIVGVTGLFVLVLRARRRKAPRRDVS